MRQRTADLRLEDHDDAEYHIGQDVGQHPGQGRQLAVARQVEERDDQRQAECHLDRAGSADQNQHLVDDERDNNDVENRVPIKRWQPEQIDHDRFNCPEHSVTSCHGLLSLLDLIHHLRDGPHLGDFVTSYGMSAATDGECNGSCGGPSGRFRGR